MVIFGRNHLLRLCAKPTFKSVCKLNIDVSRGDLRQLYYFSNLKKFSSCLEYPHCYTRQTYRSIAFTSRSRMVTSFTCSPKGKSKERGQERDITFTWKLDLSGEGAKSDQPEPLVEVFIYSPQTLYDDRFSKVRNRHYLENVKCFTLEKVDAFVFACAQDGEVRRQKSDHLSYKKVVPLSKGNYIYLYRVNGKLKHSSSEPTTFLNSKRKVNYIPSSTWDVEETDKDLSQITALPMLTPGPGRNLVPRSPLSVNAMRACLSVRELYRERTQDGIPMTVLERHIWQRTFERMSERMQTN